jgi:hypothetical protein
MAGKRPKVEPIRNPTLFEMDKLEQAGQLMNSLKVERPYSEPGLLLGTSAITAAGWQGSGHTLLLETSVYSEAGENRSSSPPSSHLMQIRSSSSCAK